MTALKHFCRKHDCWSIRGIEFCHVPSFSFVRLKCFKQREVHIACITAHSVTKGPVLYLDSGGRISFVWVLYCCQARIGSKYLLQSAGRLVSQMLLIFFFKSFSIIYNISLTNVTYDMWPAQFLYLTLTIFELCVVLVNMTYSQILFRIYAGDEVFLSHKVKMWVLRLQSLWTEQIQWIQFNILNPIATRAVAFING